jgi:hypothetical protein
MMEVTVEADKIDANDLRCPQCLHRSFVAYGTSSVARRETWENGVSVSFEVDPDTHRFEPEVIVCLHCQTKSRIKTAQVCQLEQQISDMREQILELGGEDPLKLGMPQ